jgi:phenylpropionate dioxygenase-like ring-hydroxylating dioxygenase large terminal subunit
MNLVGKQARPKAKKAGRTKSKSSGPLRAVPFKVTNPERIPAQRYYDQEFYDLECKYLWPKVWQMAARLEEIPQLGDWVEYKILDKSVIVIRTKTGVKAFHNACRHRGVQLASGHGNCENSGFICPFHGWRFDMDGKNSFVFNRQIFSPEQLEQAELNLKPCRLEQWGGCAFINFDDDAAPLLECIKPFADWHDPRAVDKLKIEWWMAAEVPANWKIAMEAFMEGYHTMRSHPQLHKVILPSKYSHGLDMGEGPRRNIAGPKDFVTAFMKQMEIVCEGMNGQMHKSEVEVARKLAKTVELPDDMTQAPMEWVRQLNDAITKEARSRKVPMPDLNSLPPVSPDNFCFPHYFLLPGFGAMSSYRIRPLGPEKCLFELYSLILTPEGEERPRPVAPKPLLVDDPAWPAIPAQDYSNIPLQQLGLHAEGFEYMRLSRDKEGAISNYHRVIDGFLEGRDRKALTRGMANACSEIDSPIREDVFAPPAAPETRGLWELTASAVAALPKSGKAAAKA